MNLHHIQTYASLIWIGGNYKCPNPTCDATMSTDHHACIRKIIRRTEEHSGNVYYCTCERCRGNEAKHYFRARPIDYGYVCKDCQAGKHPKP